MKIIMRRSLLLKLMIAYITAALFMFVLLNTYGVSKIKRNLIEEKKEVLYNEAQLISSEYMVGYFGQKTSLDNLSIQLKTIDTFLDTQIWFVNRQGAIITDTRSSEASAALNIKEQSPSFLNNYFNVNTTLGGFFKEPMLSVVSPVTLGLDFKGYIVLNTSMKKIVASSIKYTDIFNICLLIFLGFLLVIFIFLYLITVLPLKKIIKAATEYTSGHFDYPLTIRSHDEYRDLRNALIYMAGEMSNMDNYRKKFVANISHDFRSPLTSIKGYAEAMLDGTIPLEGQAKYLEIILFETERLTKLTSNLLELTQFDSKGTLLDIVTFDINQITKKTAASFEGSCTEKKITLNLVFSEKETLVDADMSKIQQVLYNLLDNAIKFSHSNSSIRISIEERNEKIFISVKDYGIGIPKESLKKIWDRFYKTDTSRGKDKKGTGLGLSITKEIVTAHGENIDVISTEGVGSEFIFTLSKSEP